jgi:hypothetical protein
LATDASSPGRVAAIGVAYIVGICIGAIVWLAGMAISNAAAVKAVAAVHLGREISVMGAYRALRGRIGRILGVFGLVMVLAAVGGFVSIFAASLIGSLAVVSGSRSGTAGTIIGVIVAIAVVVAGVVFALTVYVRYSLAVQACVVEDIGAWASLKRSAILSKGARSRVLTVWFVFGILTLIAGAVLGGIAGALGVFLHNRIGALVLIYLASFVASAATAPLATIGMSLLYYDERVRKEAFDLQLMMADLDASAAPVVAPAQI